jgi:hypothetical protein
MLLPPLIILVAATSVGTTQVRGWDGPWGGYDNGPWQSANNQPICGAFCAGEQDTVYDNDNNLQYQPYGSCLPCHGEGYWNNFKQGYDQIWNNHQSQESTQGSSININGNNNYVNTEQSSNQQQNPLQQLARTVCGFINCQNNQEQQGGP